MATTETTTVEPRTIRENLRVYDVFETGREQPSMTVTSTNQTQTATAEPTAQPDRNWPSDWRRMPAYRETSRTHRVSDRVAGQDMVEAGIVMTMFSGVWIIGAINRVWRATGGKVNDQVMRYPVGGEW